MARSQQTSLFRLAQKLLLIYRLLPFSTTSLPKRFSNPSTLSSNATLGLGGSFGLVLPLRNGQLELSRPAPVSVSFSLSAASCSCSSTWAFKLETTPSRRRNLSKSSASGGFRLLRGARPGPGKMHSILARTQFEHGCFLSHLTYTLNAQGQGVLCCMCRQLLTFRLRQVTHDRGFGVGAPPAEGPLTLPLALWPGSGEVSACGESSDMAPACFLSIGNCQRRAGRGS
jgi:hypothetical protein